MPLDARLRFDNFVVGAANKLAVAAARAAAEAPGQNYNPLFIYSASGLGKTHLLAAIGNQALQAHAGIRVEYLTLEEFVAEFHAAVEAGQHAAFRQRFDDVQVLLIDDVQFLAGHGETQTELLRLVTAMQGGGRQIVMTSDRPPVEIPDVDARLISRMTGGLIVDIGIPDFETRVAIAGAKAEERGVRFRPGVVEELARLEFRNVRELQGALNRLIAYQALGDEQVRTEDVLAVLSDMTDASLSGTPDAPSVPPARSGNALDFQSFVSDIASAVAQSVEEWRLRVAETIARWNGEGFRTSALERLLEQPEAPPNYDAVLRGFGAAAAHLKELEQQAIGLDATLAGNPVFRDPERLREAEAVVQRARTGAIPLPGPSVEYSRAGFEIGVSNHMAVRAVDAVAEAPGRRYNPLFIVGPSGVGKTHLLNALGNELVSASRGTAAVACIGAQAFIDELIAALRDGAVERWSARYRDVDALLLDDVQFVAGKERTQDELFHVFNALHSAGRQIVLASDRPPREITGLEERLRSRFEGGLVVEIQPPDRELRAQLYRRFVHGVAPAELDELVAYLADRPVDSVRELIGIVQRLSAAADAVGAPLSLPIARGELEPQARAGTPVSGMPVVRAAADVFFLDDEKVVWDWPDIPARLIEEPR